jgi:hypothetical protein
MKPFLVALVLCPLLATSALSQAPPQPLSLQEFLGLTNDQVKAIVQNNNDYNAFSSQQQDQIQQAQLEIPVETAKDPLDPMALGALYAGIETSCRAMRNKASSLQQQNVSVLTDAQKAKLSVLNDAMKLVPTISEAQSENLLGSAGSTPLFFYTQFSDTGSSFGGTNAWFQTGVLGCPSSTIYQLGMVTPTGTSQSGTVGLNTTAPANRIVNKISGDFGPGSLPQTKTQ